MKKYFIFALTLLLFGCETDKQEVESEEFEQKAVNSGDSNSTEDNVLQAQVSPEYIVKNETELSIQDSEVAYELCVRTLNDYYKAVWNGLEIELDTFIANENLKQYTQKKIESQYDLHLRNNATNEMQDIDTGAWEVEYTDDVDGGYLYLHLPVQINMAVGSYGEVTEFLVRNVNGKLVIVDWYTGAKDSYDFLVRGESPTIDNPNIWNDIEWVKKLNSKQVEFSGSTR